MPPSSYRAEAALAVGLLLLSAPLFVQVADLADPDRYVYRSTTVEFTGDGYRSEQFLADVDGDVACIGHPPRRTCMLERAIHDAGGVAYDGLPSQLLAREYRYVYGDGRFYEPVTRERNGTLVYDLEPVDREAALADVSTELREASPAVRRAIESGSVTTSDELPGAGELVATGDGYRVVYRAEFEDYPGVERDPLVFWGAWALGGLGLAVALRGQRYRVRRDA